MQRRCVKLNRSDAWGRRQCNPSIPCRSAGAIVVSAFFSALSSTPTWTASPWSSRLCRPRPARAFSYPGDWATSCTPSISLLAAHGRTPAPLWCSGELPPCLWGPWCAVAASMFHENRVRPRWRAHQGPSCCCAAAAAAAAHRSAAVPQFCHALPVPSHRGQLSAGQRRVAFDSLGMYQQLQAAGHDPRGAEAWAAARRYAAAISAILAADGIRCELSAQFRRAVIAGSVGCVHSAWLVTVVALCPTVLSCHIEPSPAGMPAAAGAPRPQLRSWPRCRSGRCGTCWRCFGWSGQERQAGRAWWHRCGHRGWGAAIQVRQAAARRQGNI